MKNTLIFSGITPLSFAMLGGECVMTVDDLFIAAVKGDIEKTKQILLDQPELLTASIDGGINNEGYHTTFGVLFSILANLRGAIRYDVLDVLVSAGADFNDMVILENDSTVFRQPLLEYAISFWKDFELANYMLDHNANPNAIDIRTKGDSLLSRTTMLWYAISSDPTPNCAEILLRHGADPNLPCEVYDVNLKAYQLLPPLYYALVPFRSFDKAVSLLHFGASPWCRVESGRGIEPAMTLDQYLKITNPDALSLLLAAADANMDFGSTANFRDSAQYAITKAILDPDAAQPKSTKKSARARRPHTEQPVEFVNKKPYSKLTAYLFANFSLVALSFCVFGPIVMSARNEPEAALGLFIFGLGSALIASLIWCAVRAKAQRYGQTRVFGIFVLEGLFLVAKVLLYMTIILIPIMRAVVGPSWESKYLEDGREIYVKRDGSDTYKDVFGGTYVEKEKD